jgi:hypothetical protein
MTVHKLAWIAIVAIALADNRCRALDFELKIRTHAQEVVFGDPLYVEVVATNKGADVVSAIPTFHSDRLRFEIRHAETELTTRKLDAQGDPSPLTFAPGKSATFYKYLFVPELHQFNHPFWNFKEEHRWYSICAVYKLRDSGIEIRSNWQDLGVRARDGEELRTLNRWAWAEIRSSGKGPNPATFGLAFQRPLDLEHMQQIASQVQPGEIADLLTLTVKMRTLYHTLPDSQTVGNRDLVEWLAKLPDIKRQSLIRAALQCAKSEAIPLASTAKALESLERSK